MPEGARGAEDSPDRRGPALLRLSAGQFTQAIAAQLERLSSETKVSSRGRPSPTSDVSTSATGTENVLMVLKQNVCETREAGHSPLSFLETFPLL